MKLELQDLVVTPQDLKALILEVQRYARWFAQASVKTRVSGAKAEAPAAVSAAAAMLLKETAAEQPLSVKRLDQLLAALLDLEKTSPRITITLAAMPGDKLKKTLAAWCREHIKPNLLVDFHFNATLLGGMVIRYGSHVYDWSFRRQILANRAKFPEVLRRV